MKHLRVSPKKYVVIAALLLGLVVTAYTLFGTSAQDCTSYEKYDAKTGECYYECSSDAECAAIEKKINDELAGYFEDSSSKLGNSDKPKAPASDTSDGHIFTRDETGSETKGTVYTLRNNYAFTPSASGNDRTLIKLIQHIIPTKDYENYLQTIEVYDDAENDTAASVWQSDTPGKWHMNINAAFMNDRKDLIHTIVHEYGHIVSLNKTQVVSVDGSCPRLSLSEGCANDSSFINIFARTYWGRYEDAPADDGANSDEVQSFYERHRNDFVSDYAATNAVEDFAETWANFVLRDKPTSTKHVKDQKVASLYNHPELVTLRNDVRARISSAVQ